MTSLDELEHRLRPQLQRALTEVMPRLEAPAGSATIHPDAVGHSEPEHLGEAPPHTSQGKRLLLTVAAGMIAVVGGVWWLRPAQIDTPTGPTEAPPIATTPDPTLDSTPPTSAPGSGPYPLDQLDPLSAARRVTLAARIEPTPDEYADLAVAGEIMSRDCMRDGGATPPALTSADHVAVRDQANEQLRQRTRLFTTDGIDALRTDGYFPDAIDDPEAMSADPLVLPISEGSFEAQLLADGCGRVDLPLRAGPVEQTLSELRSVEVDGATTGSRWADMALHPQDLPEFADEFPAMRDCMAEAGYPNFFERGAEPNPFAEFMAESGVSEEELAMANAHADCSIATNFPITYVETVSAVLDEFDREYQSELAALRSERDTALELARAVLTEHGIDPFTG